MSGGPDWTKANCLGDDAEAWYQERLTSTAAIANSAHAKAQCGLCPIKAACLVDALEAEDGIGADSRHGIRAGLTGTQRHALAKRLRKAEAEAEATPE
jgi:hypothetical protein